MDGHLNGVFWIMLVVFRLKLLVGLLDWLIVILLERGEDMGRREFFISLITLGEWDMILFAVVRGTSTDIAWPLDVLYRHVILGTVLLWVGWIGFNGGSTFAANLKAAMAIFTTNLAGSVGGLIWMILDYRLERKWSVVGFCTGAIAGLVAITPAAGYVGTPAAALIGLVAGTASNLATGLKVSMRVDDPMDVFAVHALAGVIGTLMTGL